jgi:galactitol-specific phosphotransferase system IIB component
MLKVLIICNTGAGSSAMLKVRLEQMIPENTYTACSVADAHTQFDSHDVVLTFDEIKPFVVKAMGDTTLPVKTIEGFNKFAKDLFSEYLLG